VCLKSEHWNSVLTAKTLNNNMILGDLTGRRVWFLYVGIQILGSGVSQYSCKNLPWTWEKQVNHGW